MTENLAQQAPVMRKWLWRLFWLVIPAMLAGLLTGEAVAKWSLAVYMIGLVLSTGCDLTRGMILLRLAVADSQYQKAGFFSLTATALSVIAIFLGQSQMLSYVISGAQLVIGLGARFYEYHAHAFLLGKWDAAGAARWRLLWKWYLATAAALALSMALLSVLPMLGAVLLIVATVVMLIVRIAEPVLLYSMAKSIDTQKSDGELI